MELQIADNQTEVIIKSAVLSSDRLGVAGEIDIAKIITDITLYEHILKPYVTAEIQFLDQVNILQDMDFQVKLEHGKTNIFLDCNGKNDDTFDLNKMVLAPNANVDESKDELYPFFINEAAYYEKGFGFAVAKKCIVEF